MAFARFEPAIWHDFNLALAICSVVRRIWREMVTDRSDSSEAPADGTIAPAVDASETVHLSSDAGSDAWACDRVLAVALHSDKQAFAELFAWYAPRIKAFVMRGGADADTAQEVAQEAMISVWRRATTFDPKIARPATWIYSIARNRRIDMVRRERRFEATVEDMRPLQEEEVGQADTAIVALESSDRVRAAIETLAPDQLEVIRKAFFEDKSHSQIAVELGLPLGTVKSRIRHALIRLRAGMAGDGR